MYHHRANGIVARPPRWNTFMLPITVWGLALGQALLITGNILLISVNALVGQRLAPDAQLATLPVALQFIGIMAATLPAAQLMRVMGRKTGFFVGNLIGVTGGVLACVALQRASFGYFCLSTTLLGIAIGVAQQYRFAATEACSPAARANAISLVMGGGVLAAILGPKLAVWSAAIWPQPEFIGAFAVVTALYVANMFLIMTLQLPAPTEEERAGAVRSYRVLMMQPKLVTAIVAAAIGYGVMILVMTATPIAMHSHHHAFPDTASVIQWHVLGMFLPSFFTGRLIARWGEVAIIQTGCLLLALCVVLAQIGVAYWHFWFSLVVLGLGWNFTFIGATSLLTTTYRPAEKAKVQGLNDFLVFGFSAFGSLLAGQMQAWVGWKLLNLSMIPAISLAILAVWYSNRSSRGATDAAGTSP